MKNTFDLIVIGAGSGGLVAVATACGLGARVLLIEGRKMGGDCLNYGCVPSKTFLKSCHTMRSIKKSAGYGISAQVDNVSLGTIMDRVQSVIGEIAPHDSVERFTGLGAKVILGRGKLVSKNTVCVNGEEYYGKKIIISTGSSAIVPPIPGLSDIDYYTNETIFNLRDLPKKMLVLGAGPIGLELGQGFCHLGVDVHIIDRNKRLFTKDEAEVSEYMEKSFLDDGLHVHLDSTITRFEKDGSKNVVIFNSSGVEERLEFDVVLVALGRKANTEHLGLEDIGIKTDSRGFISVNDKLQTNIKNIYAVGDVRGKYLFTHTASYEASVAVKNALIAPMFKTNYYNLAWATYTVPEVAHVGLLEKDAVKSKGYVSHILDIASNDRAKAEDDRLGFIKVIVDKKGILVGATIVGERAGEMIAPLLLMVTKKMALSSAMSVMYQYPIQGEILKMLSIADFKKNVKPWQQSLAKKIATKRLF